jgi:RNA polymerase sigma-70 factor, ECF subfamily
MSEQRPESHPGHERGVTPGQPTAITRTNEPLEDVPDLRGLVSLALRGDVSATEVLLRKVRQMVHRYIRARLGGPSGDNGAADDAAQEVCIAVLSALPRYRDEGVPFEAFVYSIAARKLADVHRAAGRRAVPVADLPDGIDLSDGPEALAVRSSEAQLARDLLQTLPDQQREILLLRVVVGLSAEETGRALGLTPGAVRVAQHRALRRLRVNAEGMPALSELVADLTDCSTGPGPGPGAST